LPFQGSLAAVELEDPARDVVEEIAVVRDGDDRTLVGLQVVLEPGDGLGVEVVGRLVEQQHVGLLQQQAAERDTAALPAGEVVDRRVPDRATERVHRHLELRVEVPGVERVDLRLHLPWRSMSTLISSSVIGSENFAEISLNSAGARPCRPPPPRRTGARSCRARDAAPGRACRR